MSNSKMLIDAAHPEETRVVVLKGNRIEEFDFESASKKQLRGNIYLAKVTRVEPSLQAAFVEYGGNRHGFLAFSEIHPDYYQIPFADRQALLEEEARAHRDEDDEGRGNGATESRSQGGGENRREGRRQEARGNGEGRNQDRSQGEGGERQARGEGRGERGSRNGERGQRRSRRHRRDHAPASALDRRGAGDDSISESLVDGDAVALNESDAAVTTEIVDRATVDLEGTAAEAHAAAPDHAGDAMVEALQAGTSQDEATAASAMPGDAPEADTTAEAPVPGGTEEPAAVTAEVVDAPVAAESGEASAFEPEHGAASAAEAEAEAVGEDAVEAPLAMEPAAAVAEEAIDEAASTTGTVGETVEARDNRDHQDDEHHEEEHVEQIGGDALSDVAPRPVRLRRHYKIQEVIKRRQILLIQVVKEERGNKGAALTTYLSLAGRYSVLMPNTAKGGGISRKITDGEDRKRLKAIAQELDVPEGMGVILRTAGAARSPIEVRRDFEYLLRMWESVRELTLKSSAPSLVYEEGSLIKRSIRDLYSKEVEEIVVSGEAGFAEARDFMRMLMPGNVKSVLSYRDPQPIFAKSGVEAQLDAMFSPHVTLKSGGYLVINQTEALVAIDVNSGRSTREHNIEDTALRTNLEAADEVARQLRLRDLAGLIVVDFIDMEEGRNNRAVERRIKEALKNDRARIQIGRISHFGLLEMSRQRIRTGVLEGSTVVCPHCAGAGTVRSTASIALHVLRLVEDALLKDASHDLVVRSRAEVALYMLNQKRAKLVELEQRFGVGITVAADSSLTGMVYHAIERGEPAMPPLAPAPRQDLVRVDSIAPIFEPGSEDGDEEVVPDAVGEAEGDVDGENGSTEAGTAETGEGDSDGRRRKRRRRRRGRDRDGQAEAATGSIDSADEDTEASEETRTEAAIDGEAVPVSASEGEASTHDAEEPTPVEASVASVASENEPSSADAEKATTTAPAAPVAVAAVDVAPVEAAPAEAPPAEEAPKRRRSRRTVVRVEEDGGEATPPVAAPEEEAPARPRRRRTTRARAAVETTPAEGAEAVATETVAVPSPAEPPAGEPPAAAPAAEVAAESRGTETAGIDALGNEASIDDPDRPKRSGWWQRAKASFGS